MTYSEKYPYKIEECIPQKIVPEININGIFRQDFIEYFNLGKMKLDGICPNCGSFEFVKNGFTKHKEPRRKCKVCGKGYSLQNPQKRLRKDLNILFRFVTYILLSECTERYNVSVKEFAQKYNLDIKTAYRWRKRLHISVKKMRSFQKIMNQDNMALEKRIEILATPFGKSDEDWYNNFLKYVYKLKCISDYDNNRFKCFVCDIIYCMTNYSGRW